MGVAQDRLDSREASEAAGHRVWVVQVLDRTRVHRVGTLAVTSLWLGVSRGSDEAPQFGYSDSACRISSRLIASAGVALTAIASPAARVPLLISARSWASVRSS